MKFFLLWYVTTRSFPPGYFSQNYKRLTNRTNNWNPQCKLHVHHITPHWTFGNRLECYLFHIRNGFFGMKFFPQNEKKIRTEVQSFLKLSGQKTGISSNDRKIYFIHRVVSAISVTYFLPFLTISFWECDLNISYK